MNGVIGSKRSASSTAAERQAARVRAEQLPLVGMLGQQADRVGELALAGVDAADQDVQHEVAQLVVAQPVARLLGLDQRRDQVVARRRPPARDQLVLVGVELGHRLLDLLALGHQAGRVELALDHVRPVMKPRRVVERGAHHLGDHQRRVRLGERPR